MDSQRVPEKVMEYYNTIHRQHPNEISEEWNEEIKEEYIAEMSRRNRNSGIVCDARNETLRMVPQEVTEQHGKGNLIIR